ncbi:FAD-dependent oxidoreductase [Nocardia puris]|uniref:3-phenylpropionate/trans-cinnamate dioxygenase ferredoxin reductase subunit n=1 Tax=Nocardia puris TaxID=208602 RepID=A0A366D2B7_9NOCA|nr:FAD-dependent oxidoreductase [Nocardia puris]MBF6213918.1 FAD-dependent oxidoreductase [Nocardia puris]MBF6368557.1 FAD-dependent oxidoreductase [Nocardia puris]MBF6463044.1 FAD-dependent oxidoreductase [Nocardia puris]RBO84212.1 3-phenylpropionate/trans-cinnamate dioxygenase ferredoxin reductase subunit [Nocardia puris]
MTERIIVVGAGVAGATAAKTLRAEGFTGEIVLVGAERGLPYRRPMVSKELLAGTAEERRTLLEPADSWRSLEVDLLLGRGVDAVDVDAKRVRFAGGESLGYDRLLLATGARAKSLPGPQRNVHTLRGAADVAPLREAIIAGGSLLIVGAGLVGCEVAATARGLGVRVAIVHAGPAPLDRIAPPAVGDYYRNLHADNGVEIHDEVVLDRLDGIETGVTALARDGRNWSAAAALIAIGSAPDTALASVAGLAVGNGILVDEHYRTSAPDVFAAGDVANRFDPELGAYERDEHWNGAQAQGAAAARSMLGKTPARPDVSWGWSTQYGRNLQFAGRWQPGDDFVVRGSVDSGEFAVLALRDGRLAGAVALARPADLRAARPLIARRAVLDPTRAADVSVPLADAVASDDDLAADRA